MAVRVPDYFPLVREQCKEQSAKLFFCINSHINSGNEVASAAERKQAVHKCASTLLAYQHCMDALLRAAEQAAADS